MKDAQFNIELTSLEIPNINGIDKVRFLFNANLGVPPAELSKVASGGELSRLMLSIKSLISERKLLPSIILDEIDMGVSGEIAGKVGDILYNMSKKMQLIAITHLPQIAGRANTHLMVYKTNKANKTVSEIKKLTKDERVVEIAKILSGDAVTDAAIKTAQELLKSN